MTPFTIALVLALRFPKTTLALVGLTALGMFAGGRVHAAVPGVGSGDPFGGSCKPVVTQGYGPTTFPGEPIVRGIRTHTGIDLACPAGTPVYAIGAGTAHVSSDSGFGNSVVVEKDGYFVRYAHLSAAAAPDRAVVFAGDLIGWEGSTGYSTGPHLHFEVDRGSPSVQNSIDPAPFLREIV